MQLKLWVSPHQDDECLWGSFTIQRERPTVCVVFDSFVQPSRGVDGCDWQIRRGETRAALRELTENRDAGIPVVAENFLGMRDDQATSAFVIANWLTEAYQHLEIQEVWAPANEAGGHEQHNLVSEAVALADFGDAKRSHYLSYTRAGGKSRGGTEVLPRSGDDIARKLRALSCYTSQMQMDPRLGCWTWFTGDLKEYVL